VYNKGIPSTASIVELKSVAREVGAVLTITLGMANVGRIDHTSLHHIVTYYNRLPDITIFLKDTVVSHSHLGISLRLLEFSRSLCPDLEFWCARNMVLVGMDWKMDDYTSEECRRFKRCYANESFIKASTRPLGRWMYKFGIIPVGPVGRPGGYFAGWKRSNTPSVLVCYGGIFAASRSSIRKSSLLMYRKLRKELSGGDSLEAGHYLERSWYSLFKARCLTAHAPHPLHSSVRTLCEIHDYHLP
jgi:hypothetical protein